VGSWFKIMRPPAERVVEERGMSGFTDGAYETILCDEPRTGVGRITLNRPQAMNAYTFAMCGELRAAIQAFADDDGLRALALTGAGARAFCTGGDIGGADPEHSRQVAGSPMGHGREMRDGMQAVVLALRRLDKPSVAMVRGYAVAGGLALALACDLRIAGASARLGDTSNKVGLLPDEGGAWLFPRAMGLDRALKMTLLHEVYDAAKAAGLGLVTEVVADDDLEARTLALCEALAAKAPLAVRLTKMMMAKAMETSLEASMVDAQMAVMVTNPSADVREGVAAFREKRAPAFKGK
jgi:2-(1,2-epoxy-1,2-dihydrophenyl)acetyl-CoA isomerase